MSCTFCKILRGELPATILEEGAHCAVLLDLNQAAYGHVLIVAKPHVAQWHELDAATAADISAMAHRWARVLVESIAPEGYNLLMNNGAAAGQDVHHAHLHLTPRSSGDGYYDFGGKRRVLEETERRALEATLLAAARR